MHLAPLTYLVLRYRLQKTNHDTLATRQLQPIRCPKCPLTIHSQPHQKKNTDNFFGKHFFLLLTHEHHHWCKLLLSTLFCNVLRVAQKWLDKYLLVKHYNQVVMTRTINCSWLIRKNEELIYYVKSRKTVTTFFISFSFVICFNSNILFSLSNTR